MNTGIRFHHPFFFVIGVILLTSGVLMRLPDFLSMEHMGYQMVGMPMSTMMLAGMACIVLGLVLSTYGLVPRWVDLRSRPTGALYLHAMDEAALKPAHWWLLRARHCARHRRDETGDARVRPARDAHGIRDHPARAALLPLIALTGTTIGSVMWGVLADRLGRRASILLAAMFFSARRSAASCRRSRGTCSCAS